MVTFTSPALHRLPPKANLAYHCHHKRGIHSYTGRWYFLEVPVVRQIFRATNVEFLFEIVQSWFLSPTKAQLLRNLVGTYDL